MATVNNPNDTLNPGPVVKGSSTYNISLTGQVKITAETETADKAARGPRSPLPDTVCVRLMRSSTLTASGSTFLYFYDLKIVRRQTM